MHMNTDAFVEELMDRLNLRQTGILIFKKKYIQRLLVPIQSPFQ